MDLVDEFMKMFSRCGEEDQPLDLFRIFDEGPKYVRNIPTEKRGLALKRILAENDGLLTFLHVRTDERNIRKEFVTAFLEGLNFLHFLVNEFLDVYKPHAVSTMACCVSIISRKTNFYLKQKSCKISLTLLHNFPNCEYQFGRIIKEWISKIKLYDNTDVIVLLRIMSTVAYCQPATLDSSEEVKRILINHFIRMYDTRKCVDKERVNILRFLISSMDNMFHNFPIESNDTLLPKVYQRLKNVSEIASTKDDTKLINSILKFMIHQMSTLKTFIRNDYEFWHQYFDRQTNSEVNSQIANESMKVYYEVIGKLLYEDDSEKNQAILQSLNTLFVKNITDKCLSSKDLRLSINGYSRIAQCVQKSYNDAAIEEMYSAIARRTLSLYFSEDEAVEQFGDIADYQEALSQILLYITNVSNDQIKQLSKLCVIMIKRFPEMSSTCQQYTVDSLRRTVCNIESLKINLSRELITSIIYEGIVWSCSHTLSIDAELQSELENLSKHSICYKDYVPLWRGLLDQKNYPRSIVPQQINNKILETCIRLIEKLNLTIKKRDNNICSNLIVSQMAENETDYKIFINLVDLYDEILDDMDSNCLTDKLPQLLSQIISGSYRHPLISGFYRLVDRILNVTDYFYDETSVDPELSKMVLQYLQNVLDLVYQFPHELQLRCVRLILNVPMIFAVHLMNEIVPVFKIALAIGLNDYELANTTLHSLEQYVSLENTDAKKFIKQLLPSLELYIRSKESTQIRDNLSKRKLISISDENLAKLQKRILLFFGRLDHSMVLDFLHEQSLNTCATWDQKDLLKYSLNFPDICLDIYLDTMLPRIIELALNSSNQKTKLAASEVLHSLVAIVLGKTVQFISANVDRFTALYKILCPALLRLGCDSDEVIRRLYNSLMLQITHWLSSKLMLHSPAVGFLVDSLFDGLSDETNFALRDFSGICLAEFTRWSIKQSSDQDLSRAPYNINTIVESITNFALHPSHCRRIGAAIAFNYLHKILSESDEIVNIFWFELFHVFIKSMNGCDDLSIWNTIGHVKKVLIDELSILKTSDPSRKIPVEFSGGTFKDALFWLLTQCGVVDKNARRKSMELFESLAPYVDENCSAKTVINEYLEIYGISSVNKIILKGLDDTTFTFSADYFKMFLRTLDCYTWLVRGQLIDNNILFSRSNKSWDVILNCINNFTSMALTVEFDKMTLENFRNEFKRNSLQCKTIVSLFDFLLEILEVKVLEESEIHETLFNKNMLALVSRCILEPRRVGFDLKNILIMESLPNQLEKVINSISINTSNTIVDNLIKQLNGDIEKISPQLFEVKQENPTEQMINLSAIKGLFLLQKCDIFERLSVSVSLSLNATNKMKGIFDTLKYVEGIETWCVELESERKLYLETLLEIHLNNEPTAAKMLIELFLTDKTHLRVIASKDVRKIRHGEYFFNTFRDAIARCLLNHMVETFEELTKWLQNNPDLVFFFIEELAMYLQHKNKYQNIKKIFANELIERFRNFEQVINNIESRKKSFMNIYRIVVRFKDNPLDISIERGPIYVWILNELTKSTDLSKSASILNDFLICLAGESTNEHFEIQFILQGLKNYRGDINNGENNSLVSAKAKECYQALLTLLPVTKSNAVLCAVIAFSMGAAKFFCNEAVNGYLKKYFDNISPENGLKSLNDIYRLFMSTVASNERFDVLTKFLLPSVSCCHTCLLEQFFDKNIAEIFRTIWQGLPLNPIDCQKLLVSQIGCYNLIELMFVRLELTRINEKYSVAACEILQNSTAGKVSQRIFRCTFQLRKLKSNTLENKDIMRKLHCAAFNCCISITSAIRDENYYLALFAENVSTDQMIWQNIVDSDKQYQLRQTFKEFPKRRRTLVNIKQSIKNNPQLNSSNHTCIKSYNLATSTLTDDIYAYDFSEVNLLPEPLYSTAAVTLEVDDLNDHECMASICGILRVMAEVDPDAPSQSQREIPKSLNCFANSMTNTHINAQLFMLKIILNNQSIFKPFAKVFLPPIINIINLMLQDGAFNYVLTDTLSVLIDWAEVAIPKNCKAEAQKMFCCMIDKVDTTEGSKYIVRYNFNIIELLVNVWHECLDVPRNLNEKMNKSRLCAIRLILIILSHPMAIKLKDRADILEFLIKSLNEHQDDKEDILLQVSEAIGLFLKMKYSFSPEDLLIAEDATLESIRQVLRSLQDKPPERLVRCVHAMSKAYPILSQFFFEFVRQSHLKVGGPTKARCLEVFLQKILYMTNNEIIRELDYLKFISLLRYKVSSCEKICLEIVEHLVPILNPADIFSFAIAASVYSRHQDAEYRKLTYSIFMKVYKKYSNDITEDYHTQMLIKKSKEVLLPGLLDPVEELQQKLTIFWTEETKFGDKCVERILNIFDTYLPDFEKNFLPILAIIILDLVKKSPVYKNKMFEPLAQSCNYKNYKITNAWRMKNLTYKIPLFTSSYATQYSQRYSLSNLTVDDLSLTNHELILRATADPDFEPTVRNETYVSEKTVVNSTHEEFNFIAPELPSGNVIFKRFVGKVKKPYKFDGRPAESRYTRIITSKSSTNKQKNTVKLNRTYRIGDFPDIEITHESVINPLEKLIMQDQSVCKNLIVSIICSLLKQIHNNEQKIKINSEDVIKNFSTQLNNVLENRQGNGLIISAILEIMFHIESIKFDTKIIGDVSKASGFNYLGALLLERHLIVHPGDSSPPPKKRRRATAEMDLDLETADWIKLAELYESTNEVDTALSIFLNHVSGYEKLHEASAARAATKWSEALDAYNEIYQSEEPLEVKQYSHQAMIECLGRLSDWDQIFVDIKGNTSDYESLNDILEKVDTVDDGWKSIWFVQAGIYQALTRTGDHNERSKFIDDLDLLANEPTKAKLLREYFAEEVAAIFAIDNPEASRDFLDSALDKIREQWAQLSPLFASLRARAVTKMRGTCNVDIYGKIVADPNKLQSVLLTYWNNSVPHPQDDLLPWDYHTSYRSSFARGLMPNLENTNNSLINDEIYSGTIANSIATLDLQMVDVAFQQKNISVMKKYLESVDCYIQNNSGVLSNESLVKNQFLVTLDIAKYRMLRGELGNDSDKIKYYSGGWKKAEGLLQKDTDINIKIAIRHLICDFSSKVIDFETRNPGSSPKRIENIRQFIYSYENIFGNEHGKLYGCIFSNLKACCVDALGYSSDKIADCHLKLLKFCHDNIMNDRVTPDLIREFVRSTLRAMNYGSREAVHYFPGLLKPEYFDDLLTKEIFIKESEKVPTWRFLMWQSELLLHLPTSLENILTPIVRRLIDQYPNAIVYTLRLFIDINSEFANHPTIRKYKQRLLDQSEVEKFVQAIEYLVRPELYLQYHLELLSKNLKNENKNEMIDRVLKKIYPESQTPSLQGKLYRNIAKYRGQIELMKTMPDEDVENHIIKIRTELKIMEKRKDSNDLKDYSPYLSQFSGSNIEIPGQYTGERKPILEYHTRIAKIESKIQVMKSIRKPIKITFIGNDAKNYNFMVKFGEDLRLDEKVEQAFNIMNEILQTDIACSRRNLSINTYQVIVLSGSFGLIQWIDNTRTLQNFINFTLDDEQIARYNSVRGEYEKWISNASPGSRKQSLQYKEALIKYNAKIVNDKMTQLIKKIKWDLLRRTFLQLSPSLESFISSRRNFMITYATMCVAQWILGIGDRHLENILISVESGRSMGIDFASAFGGGIDQAIPELAPFRLTSQILGFMRPFNEKDGFSVIMTHVLRALRSGKGPLIAYLTVVTQEQLNWEEHMNKLSQTLGGEEKSGVMSLKKRKIQFILSKLNGDKPSDIILEELKDQHYDSDYYPRYIQIVSGVDYDEGCTRSQILKENNLTPEKQVECLLDQATDLNILGRTFSGWSPWM